jgi:hypothetical protein
MAVRFHLGENERETIDLPDQRLGIKIDNLFFVSRSSLSTAYPIAENVLYPQLTNAILKALHKVNPRFEDM